MTGNNERQNQINHAVFESVVACLGQGAEIQGMHPIKKISCSEAVEALNYTISAIQNKIPLDFS